VAKSASKPALLTVDDDPSLTGCSVTSDVSMETVSGSCERTRAQPPWSAEAVETPQRSRGAIPSGPADAADERRGVPREAMKLFPEATSLAHSVCRHRCGYPCH